MVVYQVSREFYPFANAGGLKEVVTGIGAALSKKSHDSSVFIPCYGFIDKNEFDKLDSFNLLVKEKYICIDVYYGEYRGVKVYLFDFPDVSNKSNVYTYTLKDEQFNPQFKHGEGFIDTDEINIIFQLAFLYYVKDHLIAPDILSLHDAHTGLIPILIKSNKHLIDKFLHSKIFFTIHNAGYIYHQKINISKIKDYNIVNDEFLNTDGIGKYFDPLFSATYHSIPLTVSPYYADEIMNLQHENYTGDLGGFCNKHNIVVKGITNGVSLKHYSSLGINSLPLKKQIRIFRNSLKNKITETPSVIKWGSVDFEQNRPIFLFQNRITEQKGINKFIDSFKDYVSSGGEAIFVVMGEGESTYENMLIELSSIYNNQFCYLQGYDEELAFRLFLSSDFFILTSLWEPCGLTDFEAQLAGSIPIVHKTGGLQKVRHGETGFVFSEYNELKDQLLECEQLYYNNDELLQNIKKKAYKLIVEEYTWEKVVLSNYIPMFSDK
ncbi:MAG: glycogen/starch synthase [Spirochaetaceae bacterium]